MSYGYIGDTSTSIKQQVKNEGILSIDDVHELEAAGQLGGSLDFIATSTVSSGFIDLTDKFSDYDVHFLELIDITTTTQTEIGLRFSNDSGSSFETSNYHFGNWRVYEDGSTSKRKSTSQGSLRIGGDVLSNSEFNAYMYIFNANNASLYTTLTSHCTYMQGTAYATEWGHGVYAASETVNGIRIGQGILDVLNNGTAKLYGIKQ